MLYFILSYIGGALTIFAPCILPVVPFLFARIDQPFVKSGLPMLLGMALTFAGVASLGAVAGDWAVQANEYGRMAALAVLALMGLMLIAPGIATRISRPVVALGSRLTNDANNVNDAASPDSQGRSRSHVLSSFLLGVATGLLWAPCAGPVLGLILTGAVLQGPSVHTSLLLLAYAAGAATSLAVLLSVGQRVFAVFKRSMNIGEGLRRGVGVAVIAGVAAIALGFDTGTLAQYSLPGSNGIEQRLLEKFPPKVAAYDPEDASVAPMTFMKTQQKSMPDRPKLNLPSEGSMPAIVGAVDWLNSAPLTAADLKGKVVLVDFWTFGCINCKNALPYVREWNRKYKDQGLVVLGVHSPEFAYEKQIPNVKRALVDLGISFPVAVDNNFAIWRAFNNNYWPAHYFIDAKGQIRFHHFGEGEYEKSEQVIQQLLEEARKDRQAV